MSKILLAFFLLSQAFMSFVHAQAHVQGGYEGHQRLNTHHIDLDAYALPDGSMPVLCLTEDEAESHAAYDCELCSLTKAVLGGACKGFVLRGVSLVTAVTADVFVFLQHERTNPARGPPLS